MKHKHPPAGGALPSRRDDKMSMEHATSLGPWKGTWAKMLKKSATKKRRQRDKTETHTIGKPPHPVDEGPFNDQGIPM